MSKSRAFEIYNNEAAAVVQPEPVVIVEGEATGAYLGHWSQSNVSGTAREYDSSNPTSLQSPGNQKSLPFDEPQVKGLQPAKPHYTTSLLKAQADVVLTYKDHASRDMTSRNSRAKGRSGSSSIAAVARDGSCIDAGAKLLTQEASVCKQLPSDGSDRKVSYRCCKTRDTRDMTCDVDKHVYTKVN